MVAPGSPILAAIDRRFPGVVVDGRAGPPGLRRHFADPVARHDLSAHQTPRFCGAWARFGRLRRPGRQAGGHRRGAAAGSPAGDALVDEVWVVHAGGRACASPG